MEPESTPPTEQSQKAPKDTHLTIRVHKKAAISIGIIVIMLLAFVLSFDTLNKSLMRTFPQLNPLSNDIPEVTVVEEEYIDVSADPNRAKRKGIEKCGTIPDIESIPSGHWDVVDGPYWILDCKHLVWHQWTTGTGWIDENPNSPTQELVDNSRDGLYIYNVEKAQSVRIAMSSYPNIVITTIGVSYVEYRKDGTVTKHTVSEASVSQNQKLNLDTMILYPQKIAGNPEILLIDETKLYSFVLNGSDPITIATLDEQPSLISYDKDSNDLFIKNGHYEDPGKLANINLSSKEIKHLENVDLGLFTQQDIYYDHYFLNSYRLIYAQSSNVPVADIYEMKMNWSEPQKIGHIQKPIEPLMTCIVEGLCREFTYPFTFSASFDGSYLLSNDRVPSYIYKRDGEFVQKIDNGSGAFWIGDSTLLIVQNTTEGRRIKTLNLETKQERDIQIPNLHFFEKAIASPDGKYVATEDRYGGLTLLQTIDFIADEIEKEEKGASAKYSLYGFDSSTSGLLYGVIDTSSYKCEDMSESIFYYSIKSKEKIKIATSNFCDNQNRILFAIK